LPASRELVVVLGAVVVVAPVVVVAGGAVVVGAGSVTVGEAVVDVADVVVESDVSPGLHPATSRAATARRSFFIGLTS
jgi:2-keto-3-deoxy-6-phosphogluconate aldolase